jgi:hypothetical protein
MLAASLLEILDLYLPTTGAPALADLLESARKKTGVLVRPLLVFLAQPVVRGL